jgi:hypothetical protein
MTSMKPIKEIIQGYIKSPEISELLKPHKDNFHIKKFKMKDQDITILYIYDATVTFIQQKDTFEFYGKMVLKGETEQEVIGSEDFCKGLLQGLLMLEDQDYIKEFSEEVITNVKNLILEFTFTRVVPLTHTKGQEEIECLIKTILTIIIGGKK